MTKRRVFAVRVDAPTVDIVDQIAWELKCCRITGEGRLKGSTGRMLDRIARGELKVVRADQ